MAAESVGASKALLQLVHSNSGKITTGFGNIKTGSSTITTTGAGSTAALTAERYSKNR